LGLVLAGEEFLVAPAVARRGMGRRSRFLHCAADGETVRRFGRNDGFLDGLKNRQAKSNGLVLAVVAKDHQSHLTWLAGAWVGEADFSTARRTVRLSAASVEMIVDWPG
jgi:hypothetical protein